MSDRKDNRRPWHGPHRPAAATVTAVLSAQCPHVLIGPVRYLSEGWDFTAFDVDDVWIARFPKRADVAPGIPRERRVLEALDDLGAALVPADRFYGEASERFPLPFVVHRKIHGVSLDSLGLRDVSPDAARRLGATVGSLLRALHDLPLSLVDGTEGEEEGMEKWLSEAKAILARIRPELPPAVVERAADRLENPPPATPKRVVTHADLGPEHILIDPATHVVTGLIDWEDAGPWEASGDFVGLWAELGEPALRAALHSYGGTGDEHLADRVRFHATRWMLHQVKTAEDGWQPESRGRWIARLTDRSTD